MGQSEIRRKGPYGAAGRKVPPSRPDWKLDDCGESLPRRSAPDYQNYQIGPNGRTWRRVTETW
jgi:hypothetical protein